MWLKAFFSLFISLGEQGENRALCSLHSVSDSVFQNYNNYYNKGHRNSHSSDPQRRQQINYSCLSYSDDEYPIRGKFC